MNSGLQTKPTGQNTNAGVSAVLRLIWTDATLYVKVRIVLALLFVTTASTLTALGPAILKHVIDGLASATRQPMNVLIRWAIIYAVVQWGVRALTEARGFVYARAERRMTRKLNSRLFSHLLRLPLRYHLNRKTGGINQAFSNGTQGYQQVMHAACFILLPVTAELATSLLVLSRLGAPIFIALFGGAILFYILVFYYAAKKTLVAARRSATAQIEAAASMTDSLLNYEVVKCFVAEHTFESRVDTALARSEQEGVRVASQFSANGILVGTIYATFLLVTILLATAQVLNGHLTLGAFVLVNTYMAQIVRPIEQLGYAVQTLSQGIAYLHHVLELLRERTEEGNGAFGGRRFLPRR